MGPRREHTLTFADFADAMDALRFLVQHGYRELKGSLERLVPKSARIVAGTAFGLRRGTFVLCGWTEPTNHARLQHERTPRLGPHAKGSTGELSAPDTNPTRR